MYKTLNKHIVTVFSSQIDCIIQTDPLPLSLEFRGITKAVNRGHQADADDNDDQKEESC